MLCPCGAAFLTLATFIMDLNEGVLHITDGPPCQREYGEHRFSKAVDAMMQQPAGREKREGSE